jgi:hypothetical protein
VNRLPRWRIAAAFLILGALAYFLALFAPFYLRNWQMQSFVANLTQNVESPPRSDQALLDAVMQKARQLGLPITEDEVHVTHPPDAIRIDIRYFVTVDVPGYTVNLHFYPGAGSD